MRWPFFVCACADVCRCTRHTWGDPGTCQDWHTTGILPAALRRVVVGGGSGTRSAVKPRGGWSGGPEMICKGEKPEARRFLRLRKEEAPGRRSALACQTGPPPVPVL